MIWSEEYEEELMKELREREDKIHTLNERAKEMEREMKEKEERIIKEKERQARKRRVEQLQIRLKQARMNEQKAEEKVAMLQERNRVMDRELKKVNIDYQQHIILVLYMT